MWGKALKQVYSFLDKWYRQKSKLDSNSIDHIIS